MNIFPNGTSNLIYVVWMFYKKSSTEIFKIYEHFQKYEHIFKHVMFLQMPWLFFERNEDF